MELQKKTTQIFFACGIGALLGSLIALELNFLWPVGALVGGAVACFVYDFKRILDGVKYAGKHACENAGEWRANRRKKWRANRRNRRLQRIEGTYILSAILGITFWALLVPTFLVATFEGSLDVDLFFGFTEGLLMGALVVCSIFFVVLPMGNIRETLRAARRAKEAHECLNILIIPVYMVRGFLWVLRKIPAGFVFWGRFLKMASIYIYSRELALCFVWAAIGTTAGFLAGNPLVGFAVGALLGALNYEVLSVRVLKLVSKK